MGACLVDMANSRSAFEVSASRSAASAFAAVAELPESSSSLFVAAFAFDTSTSSGPTETVAGPAVFLRTSAVAASAAAAFAAYWEWIAFLVVVAHQFSLASRRRVARILDRSLALAQTVLEEYRRGWYDPSVRVMARTVGLQGRTGEEMRSPLFAVRLSA